MSDHTRSLACAGLIVLVGVLTYASSLSGPFLFDDHSAIVRNPQTRHLWPLVEALAAPRDNELASRPLVNFSFASRSSCCRRGISKARASTTRPFSINSKGTRSS